MKVVPDAEQVPESLKQRFEIEVGREKFEFTLLPSIKPSDTLLFHFPGFMVDGEEYVEPMHYEMDQRFNTLTFKGYGEHYTKESLVQAIEQALQSEHMKNVVLHGSSFGSSVVYDLITDPQYQEFIEKNGIVGAILETPVLGKDHINRKFRILPTNVLIAGAVRLAESRKENPRTLDVARFAEMLREKTEDKKISIPLHVVFAEHDTLLDNEKTMATLQQQAVDITSQVVESAKGNRGHQVADYEDMWHSEKEVVLNFVTRAEEKSKEV